jgi:hypothetical protein
MLKIIFLKKYYFDVFSNKKYFEYHNLFVIWSVSYSFLVYFVFSWDRKRKKEIDNMRELMRKEDVWTKRC